MLGSDTEAGGKCPLPCIHLVGLQIGTSLDFSHGGESA